MSYALGLDIGGTNLKAVAVTPRGRTRLATSAPTADTGTTDWIARVRELCAQVTRELGGPPAWTGVAAPGLAAADGSAINTMPARLAGLEGRNWSECLALPHRVPVLNDAHAALLGERWRGAARGTRHAVMLTLGTGVGGAAVVDGRLLRGHLGRAGHLGHVSLDPAGPLDVVNTPGSLEDAIAEKSLGRRTGGRYASTAEMVAAVGTGDPFARAVWQTSVRALAAAVASFINAFGPEVVVIGGGIAKAGPALFVPLAAHLDQFEWRPGGARARIEPARLGDYAAAYGAAWNARRLRP